MNKSLSESRLPSSKSREVQSFLSHIKMGPSNRRFFMSKSRDNFFHYATGGHTSTTSQAAIALRNRSGPGISQSNLEVYNLKD